MERIYVFSFIVSNISRLEKKNESNLYLLLLTCRYIDQGVKNTQL